MSQFYYNSRLHQPTTSPHPSFPTASSGAHHHHGGRSRRVPRYNAQSSRGHVRQQRSHKDALELTQTTSFRKDFEAARSFDLEDDEAFCPWHLLTEDDLQSMHSSSSDRSSSSDGSPGSSPLQHQINPTPSYPHPAMATHAHAPSNPFQQSAATHLKIHQPMAQRTRNAIPIVDPNSRNTSPPSSISPAAKAFTQHRRW